MVKLKNKDKIKYPSTYILEREIDLHIAEYNALTTRVTYFINFQNILLTALIAWIIFVASLWDSQFENIISWGLLLGAQVIGIINAYFTNEYYTIVKYIESDLKPKIVKLIKNESFWGYEPFLIIERGKKNRNNWRLAFEFLAVILSGVIIIAIFIYRFHNWIWGDSLGFFLNIILFIIQFIQTNHGIRLRLRNWQ